MADNKALDNAILAILIDFKTGTGTCVTFNQALKEIKQAFEYHSKEETSKTTY